MRKFKPNKSDWLKFARVNFLIVTSQNESFQLQNENHSLQTFAETPRNQHSFSSFKERRKEDTKLMRCAELLSLFNLLFVDFFNSKWVEYCCRHQRFYSNLCTCPYTSSFKSEYFLMRFWQSPFSSAFLIALK